MVLGLDLEDLAVEATMMNGNSMIIQTSHNALIKNVAQGKVSNQSCIILLIRKILFYL